MTANTRIDVAGVRAAGLDLAWKASAEECLQIADRLGLEAIGGLEAEVTLTPWRGGGVRAEGRVRARVIQLCVVTLEPVECQIDAAISEAFRPHSAGRGDVVIDVEASDDAEPFDGTMVDVAGLVVDTVAMELDPYPRAEGASLDLADMAEQG